MEARNLIALQGMKGHVLRAHFFIFFDTICCKLLSGIILIHKMENY